VATFGEALNRLQIEGNDGSAVIPEDWAQGRTVFGGLQVALAVRAMRAAMGEASALPLRCVQATFVAPLPTSQPLQLRAEVLRAGRAVTHARCDLLHDAVLACTAVGIFGAPRLSSITLDIPRPPGTGRSRDFAGHALPPGPDAGIHPAPAAALGAGDPALHRPR
jgi:acyl-CoA thioesterase